ncbi:MAG: MBOAT family O-acyltransferase [Candidatus Korobacteraceae bacterium]
MQLNFNVDGGNLFRIISYALAFLLCAVILATVRSRPIRLGTLLLASYALYLTWGVWLAAVLLVSTVMNYLVGEWLRRSRSGITLSIGMFLNVALLSIFKYLPEATVHLPFASLQRFAHLALPVGISFWTFQAMSYLFDVYQGDDVEPSFFEFALYMVFFPVTISGPICRMSEMLPQFRSESTTRSDDISRGCRRIATGVLMMQLAKLLGQGILAGDGIASGFDHVASWSGPDVWCLAFGFGLQLFFDFAGYSHIAIGAAQVLGFTIPENFARPFESTSPSIFWTRWHMSLSFWIRDYVFFPLMRLRREAWWRSLSLVVAMVLFGLWHKASFLFLLWGAYHGLLLLLHRQVEGAERRFDWTPPRIPWTALSGVSTITLVNLGWIFFRANSLHQAGQMLSAILSPASYRAHVLTASLYCLVLALAVGYAIVLLVIDSLNRVSTEALNAEVRHTDLPIGKMALLARWRWFWLPPLYVVALLFVLIVTMSRGTSAAQMMYGNF